MGLKFNPLTGNFDIDNNSGGGGSASWGSITGTLSNQTDLQSALDLKADSSSLATVATTGDYSDLSNKPTIPTSHTQLSDIGTNTHTQIDTAISNSVSHIANTSNPHNVTYTQVGADPAGTDNSTNVTLAGTPNYLTLSGQQITLNQIDLTTDVTGLLPSSNIVDAFVLNTGDTMTGNLTISSGGLTVDGATVFNEIGADVDFRVEGVSQANALFVQGSDGFVGIGTSAPSTPLHVVGGTTIENGSITLSNDYVIQAKDTGGTARSIFQLNSSDNCIIGYGVQSGNDLRLAPGGSAKVYVKASTGYVGIGTDPNKPLDLLENRSDNTANPLAGFRQVWSPTTTSGSQFPTVFQLLPEYNSTHSPSAGFLTGFRTFAYIRDSGAIPVRNCDIYTANLGTASVDNIRDVVIRSVGNLSSGSISLYEALLIQNSTAATVNHGIIQQGASMTNYFQGSVSFGTTGEPRTAVSVADHITPYLDNTYDLGTATYRWDDVYATNGSIITSDINQKDDIEDSPLGLEFIKALRPVKYKWKNYTTTHEVPNVIGYDDDNQPIETIETVETEHTFTRPHYGMIAQEVKQVMIDQGISDFGGYIEGDEIKGLRYTEFIAPMIKAIQELTTRLEALEGTV